MRVIIGLKRWVVISTVAVTASAWFGGWYAKHGPPLTCEEAPPALKACVSQARIVCGATGFLWSCDPPQRLSVKLMAGSNCVLYRCACPDDLVTP